MRLPFQVFVPAEFEPKEIEPIFSRFSFPAKVDHFCLFRGYTAGLLLQKAIINADSADPEAVKAALNAMDLMTFYGGIQFDTSEEAHGLQIAHKMVVAQWQMNDAGELTRVIIAPADVATAEPLYPIPAP